MTSQFLDRRVLPAVCSALLLLLSACSALPERPVRPAQYDFGPASVPAAAEPARQPLPVLALGESESGGGVFESSTVISYRLAYAGDQQLHPYAQARWTLPPAQLVRQRLRDHLSARYTVLGAGEGAALKFKGAQSAGRLLRLELEEFSQVFDSPASSRALLRLRATLLAQGGAGEALLGQHVFVVQTPAATADAAGGVQALAKATDDLARALDQWMAQIP